MTQPKPIPEPSEAQRKRARKLALQIAGHQHAPCYKYCVDLIAQALADTRREALEKAANTGSKAAWMHFHTTPEGEHPHVCNKSDWSFAEAVERAVRALIPQGDR